MGTWVQFGKFWLFLLPHLVWTLSSKDIFLPYLRHMTHILPLCLQYLSQILSLLPHSAPLASSNFQDGATKRHYHLNSYPPLGCPYLQKSLQKNFSKRYVIPIYKKMHFSEFQSFPSSSSFGKSKFKNTKEIFKNTKEKCWFWNFCKFPFEIFLFSILNFMAGFLRF